MSLASSLKTFNAQRSECPAIGMRVEATDHHNEVPVHQHQQGQLVLTLKGGVTCEVRDALWMVPPTCAVWIPSQIPHSVRATANARICYLFVRPDAAQLPARCCTLSISPLVRELILHLSELSSNYALDGPAGRKAIVLLEELATMPIGHLHLPISEDPRIRKIAQMLGDNPADRRNLAQWGKCVAMSERSLARLMRQETGLTFGRWRQQLHLIVALRQLCAGQTVQRVAEELGYESVTAFITMFKKSLGKPPAKYFATLKS